MLNYFTEGLDELFGRIEFGVSQSIIGFTIAVLVAFVILGGIKSIGNVASKLVPIMSLLGLTYRTVAYATSNPNTKKGNDPMSYLFIRMGGSTA